MIYTPRALQETLFFFLSPSSFLIFRPKLRRSCVSYPVSYFSGSCMGLRTWKYTKRIQECHTHGAERSHKLHKHGSKKNQASFAKTYDLRNPLWELRGSWGHLRTSRLRGSVSYNLVSSIFPGVYIEDCSVYVSPEP